jgi:tRNA-dihydrouridine synthase
MLEHIDKVLEHEQDTGAMIPMRAHFAFYTKGFTNGARARQIIFNTIDPNEIKDTLRKLVAGEL